MDHEVLIEKYLKGTLSEKEQAEFDTLRGADKAFDQEVIFHENLKAVLAAESDAVREMVEDFESEQPLKSSTTGVWKKLLVAASIFAVLGLAVFYNLSQPISSSDLYENYFERYPNVVKPMVRGAEPDAADKAFDAYDNERFEEALTRFTTLYETDGSADYLFYKAITFLELERAEEAIELLEKYAASNDKGSDKAIWYLAMAYLQLDDQEQARAELKKVMEEKAYNAGRAEELLAELE